MNDKRTLAILNNNDLYEAIFKPQTIESKRNDSIWYCVEKTPPLYSNLVTLQETWIPDEVFRAIDKRYSKENWGEWSIKDSFGVLDLRQFGFAKLFDAQWLYLEAKNFKPQKTIENLSYHLIETGEELSEWRIAWDSSEQLGKEIFKAELLNNPKIHFVAGYDRDRILSGCIINKTKDVLGVSNFFSPSKKVEHWSDLVDFILRNFGHSNLVGYEQDDIVEIISELGFESIGDLSVWIKM